MIYLARKDKEGGLKGSSNDGVHDTRQLEHTERDSTRGSARSTKYHEQRSVAEILKGDSPELAKLRDAVT